jgi:hypothetical protein
MRQEDDEAALGLRGSFKGEKASLKDFQARVGSIMYLSSTTRPDVCLAVSKLAQGSRQPNEGYWDQLACCLRYLQATKKLTLSYQGGRTGEILTGYCDSSYIPMLRGGSTS